MLYFHDSTSVGPIKYVNNLYCHNISQFIVEGKVHLYLLPILTFLTKNFALCGHPFYENDSLVYSLSLNSSDSLNVHIITFPVERI